MCAILGQIGPDLGSLGPEMCLCSMYKILVAYREHNIMRYFLIAFAVVDTWQEVLRQASRRWRRTSTRHACCM